MFPTLLMQGSASLPGTQKKYTPMRTGKIRPKSGRQNYRFAQVAQKPDACNHVLVGMRRQRRDPICMLS